MMPGPLWYIGVIRTAGIRFVARGVPIVLIIVIRCRRGSIFGFVELVVILQPGCLR